jgi:hypothetical protein
MRIRKKSIQFCRDQLCNSEELAIHEILESEEFITETTVKASGLKCPHCGCSRMHRYAEFLRSRTKCDKLIAA